MELPTYAFSLSARAFARKPDMIGCNACIQENSGKEVATMRFKLLASRRAGMGAKSSLSRELADMIERRN